MFSISSHSLGQISQEILGDEGDADVWGDSEVESGEANPHLCKSFVLDCLAHCIENIFIGESSISIFLHFLDLCLGIVKGQTNEGRKEPRD